MFLTLLLTLELLSNAYIDYFTTIEGIQSPMWEEGNPVGIYIFNHTNYKQQQIIGALYLIGLSQLYRLPKPLDIISMYAFDIGHFWGVYTWRNTGYLKYPIKLTLFRIEW